MKDMPSITAKTKVKVLRNEAVGSGVQQMAWPSAETPGEPARPVALPSQPRVELQKHPDGKTTIVVTCTCGKRTEIACES